MLDFNNIIRVKARFAPADIIRIEPFTYYTEGRHPTTNVADRRLRDEGNTPSGVL